MKCSIKSCAGKYQEKQIIHTVHNKEGVAVIDHVPADVCSVCGDILLKPDTIRHIEKLLQAAPAPVKNIPLYEYA